LCIALKFLLSRSFPERRSKPKFGEKRNKKNKERRGKHRTSSIRVTTVCDSNADTYRKVILIRIPVSLIQH